MRTALVAGAGGFIGSHIVDRLKKDGYFVRGVDLKNNEFRDNNCDEFIIGDLRNPQIVSQIMFAPKQESLNDKVNSFDMVFCLAANMGGMGFLATGENDADIMHDSALININLANFASLFNAKKLLYSSSACIYPENIQTGVDAVALKESCAWCGVPESQYGVEKLFSEGLYDSHRRNRGIDVRICRFHNVFGEYTLYDGIRAKAPAAICRKVAMAKDGESIDVWGDGLATRSFLYVEEAVEGVMRLMESDYNQPINIGSDELISVNDLAKMIIKISGKNLSIKNIAGVQGVRGRNSDNTLIQEILGWRPTSSLKSGIEKLYSWVSELLRA